MNAASYARVSLPPASPFPSPQLRVRDRGSTRSLHCTHSPERTRPSPTLNPSPAPAQPQPQPQQPALAPSPSPCHTAPSSPAGDRGDAQAGLARAGGEADAGATLGGPPRPGVQHTDDVPGCNQAAALCIEADTPRTPRIQAARLCAQAAGCNPTHPGCNPTYAGAHRPRAWAPPAGPAGAASTDQRRRALVVGGSGAAQGARALTLT